MCKKKVFPLIIIFLFLYVFNCLTPMGFGDDYLYSFIWQGNPEFVPLTTDATRISSWQDLFASQWSHYFTWSGRTVNHTIAQFFLWMGKDVFNFFNAFTGTLLVVEIYWCIHKGQFAFEFNLKELWGICFALWAFTPGFVSVYLWLDGACNYLWTSVLLLGFMLPYIRKYYCFSEPKEKSCLFSFAMFLYGVLTGWTNENSICLIIFVLLLFLYKKRDCCGTQCWMYTGLAGLITGYMLLMFSPGNVVRLQSVHGLNGLSLTVITHGFHNYLNNLLKIIIFQFFMWYLCLRALLTLKQLRGEIQDKLKKDLLLAKVLCCITCGMSVVMLLSPEFPLRSGFPGTVQLIIATGILFRVQKDCKMHFFTQTAKKLMTYASVLFFAVTVSVSVYNLYILHMQTEELLTYISQNHMNLKKTTLTVKPFRKAGRLGNFLSGFHIIENDLTEDENSWINVAFARYYGIKGVRLIKEGTDCE